MKYLILGGNGFIGSALRENLLHAGHSVLTFGLEADPNCPAHNGDLTHLQGDFSDYSTWRPILEEYSTVFHCISTTTPHTADLKPSFDLESNTGALLRFLPFAAAAAAKVIFVSSAGTVYGATTERFISESHPTDPICAYGVGKLAMEKYLHFYHHRHGLSYAVARVSNPFGERQNLLRPQGAVGVFLRKAMLGEPIEIWGDGQVVRDFIYISDVAEALVRISEYDGPYPVFNVGMGEGKSVNQIVSTIESVLGKSLAKVYMPGRPEDVPYNVLSTRKARELLGWRPAISFEEGLAKTVRWVRQETLEDPEFASFHAQKAIAST
jgi:UDP-glucose 4-epimerase